MRNVVWALPAMEYFAQAWGEVLGWNVIIGAPIGECDKVFVVGMYDPPLYETTLECIRDAKEVHYHFCGTDVVFFEGPRNLREGTFSADTEALVEELWTKGVKAEKFWLPPIKVYEPTPLPEGQKVACYLGTHPPKYGVSALMSLMTAMPEVQWHNYTFGEHEDMTEVILGARACVRLTDHDGGCMSAREFMRAGRRALITADIPHAIRLNKQDIPQMVSAIRKALREPEPDMEASAYYAEQDTVEVARARAGELGLL